MDVREEYFDGNYRVVRIDSGSWRVYSIDHVARLRATPPCRERLDAGSPAKLCYVPLGGGCEAVVIELGDAAYVVSLRLVARHWEDPASGSLAEARRHCIKRLEEALGEGLQPPLGG